MMLYQVIEFLEQCDPAHVAPLGFANPHSYRGYYEWLAFEPTRNVTVGEMLASARKAIGATYRGYKGGEYTMGKYTDVYLAMPHDIGESIGPVLLAYMTNVLGHAKLPV